MDELMIFDRPLEGSEVAALHVNQGGCPVLSIERTFPDHVRLSWRLGATAYQLESTFNLLSGAWDIVPDTVIASPNHFTLDLAPDTGTKFFRLHKP
jgi:hypothetical protein